mgnify:CR=1 FL=1
MRSVVPPRPRCAWRSSHSGDRAGVHDARRTSLDSARVQHDAHAAADRLGRKVLRKLCAHDTAVPVWPADLAPDHTELAAVDLALGLVDVRQPARASAQRPDERAADPVKSVRHRHARGRAVCTEHGAAVQRAACARSPLAEVEVHGGALVDALDLNERRVVVLVGKTPLVPQDRALAPEPNLTTLLLRLSHFYV